MKTKEISIQLKEDVSVGAVTARINSISGFESLDKAFPGSHRIDHVLRFIAKFEEVHADQALSEIKMDPSVQSADYRNSIQSSA
jgi:hypothetical protein